ncbi:hypothetical protein GCM10020260_15660 [Nesterenkonia halobia]|uniref:Uncharacterized protein n=1 Tax=Nesterenkonia halobia TaxID=37922 RepID=A0ABP6RD04_9MICC
MAGGKAIQVRSCGAHSGGMTVTAAVEEGEDEDGAVEVIGLSCSRHATVRAAVRSGTRTGRATAPRAEAGR